MSKLVWVAIPVPSVVFAREDIAFCPIEGKLVLVGRDAATGLGKAYKSTNAIAWTELVVPYAASEFFGVKGIDLTVDRGRIVLVSVNRVYEKDIDDVWTEIHPTDFVDCTALGYLPGIGFCSLNSFGGSPTVYLSNGGVTWEGTSSTPVLGTNIRSGGGYLLRFGTAGVSLSPDGYWWSSASPGVGFGTSFGDVTYHNGVGTWFAVRSAGGAGEYTYPTKIFKSIDVTGENWNLGTPVYTFNDAGASILPGALIYDPFSDKLVLFGYYNIYTSDNLGVTWVKQSAPASPANADKACLGNGSVLIAGDEHIFLGSTNVTSLFSGTASVTPPTDLTRTKNADDVTLNWTDNDVLLLGDIIELKISDGINIVDFFPIATSITNSSIITDELIESVIQDSVDSYDLDVDTEYILTWRVKTFRADGISTPSTSPADLVFAFVPAAPPATADIDIVDSGGIDLGGTASMVFSSNPSGIYTITPGKSHDTLYERTGVVTTIDVKIPDPFIKTAFLGDE